MKKKPCTLDIIAFVLVIIGGLNLGLFGIAHYDLIATLLGDFSTASRTIYVLIGLSAVYGLVRGLQCRKCCNTAGPSINA